MLLKLLVEGKYSFSFSIPCFFVKEYYITKVFVGCDVSNNDNQERFRVIIISNVTKSGGGKSELWMGFAAN